MASNDTIGILYRIDIKQNLVVAQVTLKELYDVLARIVIPLDMRLSYTLRCACQCSAAICSHVSRQFVSAGRWDDIAISCIG